MFIGIMYQCLTVIFFVMRKSQPKQIMLVRLMVGRQADKVHINFEILKFSEDRNISVINKGTVLLQQYQYDTVGIFSYCLL